MTHPGTGSGRGPALGAGRASALGLGRAPFRRPGRPEGRLLLGVCAGLARRWRLDPFTVRAAFLITLLPLAAGLLLYLALALVMPADSTPAGAADWRADLGRALVRASATLGALLALAVIATFAGVLSLIGLQGVVLVLACLVLAALVAIDEPAAPRILGSVALALALPAAGVLLSGVSVKRQVGLEVDEITSPADVDPAGYRAGAGPLLLDLRDFRAPAGSVTTIRARADLRMFVVAVPHTRCVNLVVDHRLATTWLSRLLDHRRPTVFQDETIANGLAPTAQTRRAVRAGAPASLLAFGQPVAGPVGRYTRTVGNPAAPTIHLELASGRSQIIVRDYPARVQPALDPFYPRYRATTVDEADEGGRMIAGPCASRAAVNGISAQLIRRSRMEAIRSALTPDDLRVMGSTP